MDNFYDTKKLKPQNDMNKVYALSMACFLLNSVHFYGQNIEIEFQDASIQSGCYDYTNCDTDSLCFAINYYPLVSGTMTSYTLGLIGNCIDDSSPYLEGGSCVMTDNTVFVDYCESNDAFLLQASGFNGSMNIDSGEVVVLHILCFDIGNSESIVLEEDQITGLTLSIDSLGTGSPFTDFPSFVNTSLEHTSCPCYIELLSPTDNLTQIIPCQTGIDSIKFEIGGTTDLSISNLPLGLEYDLNNQILSIYGVPEEFGLFNSTIELQSSCFNTSFEFDFSTQSCIMVQNQCFLNIEQAVLNAQENDIVFINCDIISIPVNDFYLPANISVILGPNISWEIQN